MTWFTAGLVTWFLQLVSGVATWNDSTYTWDSNIVRWDQSATSGDWKTANDNSWYTNN